MNISIEDSMFTFHKENDTRFEMQKSTKKFRDMKKHTVAMTVNYVFFKIYYLGKIILVVKMFQEID